MASVNPQADAQAVIDSGDPARMIDWLNDQTQRLNDRTIPLANASAEFDAGLAIYRALEEHLQEQRRMADRLSARVKAAMP